MWNWLKEDKPVGLELRVAAKGTNVMVVLMNGNKCVRFLGRNTFHENINV